jgi:hypothetical protein
MRPRIGLDAEPIPLKQLESPNVMQEKENEKGKTNLFWRSTAARTATIFRIASLARHVPKAPTSLLLLHDDGVCRAVFLARAALGAQVRPGYLVFSTFFLYGQAKWTYLRALAAARACFLVDPDAWRDLFQIDDDRRSCRAAVLRFLHHVSVHQQTHDS